MEKKDMRLYNAVFPIWLLWLFPVTWLVALPANFLIDLLVVVLTMVRLKIPDKKKTVKCTIWKVWIAGFIADFAGALAMSAMVLLPVRSIPVLGTWLAENVAYPIGSNPFTNIFAFFWVTGCVLLTAFLIYRLNLGWCLKKADLDDGQKKKIALSLAVFPKFLKLNHPYLFYLPTVWFV